MWRLALIVLAACADPRFASMHFGLTTAQQIQADIDAAAGGGEVYLAPGVYVIDETLYYRDGVTIRGAGSGVTTIRLDGLSYPGAINMLWAEDVSGIALIDLTLDGQKDLVTAPYQSHGVHVDTVSGFRVSGVEFRDLEYDGVKLIGGYYGTDPPTDRVRVTDSEFVGCGRNGITVQRNVHRSRFVDNDFVDVTVQSIDFEPGGEVAPSAITIRGNLISCSTATIGATLSGVSAALPSNQIRFESNILSGCGVQAVWLASSAIVGNSIYAPGVGGIDLERNISDVTIASNTIEAKTAIRLGAVYPDQVASRVAIVGNIITHDWVGITNDGGSDITIAANTIMGLTGAYTNIQAQSTAYGAPITGVTITGNSTRGVGYDIRLHPSPYAISDVAVGRNVVGDASVTITGTITNLVNTDNVLGAD